jgi:tetraacyldisaccharide 4'-kinase
VVSVGNLAMGGRGKTPVVAHLARTLLSAGYRPAILSRGYAARQTIEGAVIVSDGTHLGADVHRSGDEPLMLARSLPGAIVIVSRDRALAGTIAERVLDADVHILDDGFQHRRLARDIDVVIVAPEDLTARRLPFGPLRETARALRRADIVLIENGSNRDTSPDLKVRRFNPTVPIFSIRRRLGSPVELEADGPSVATGARVLAVAGISEPERFARALREVGWDVAGVMGFRDHHPYGPADLARIRTAVSETGASAVLTTEKDAVRMLPLRPFSMPIAAVPLRIEITPQEAFDQWLLNRLRAPRPRA